MYVPRRIPWRHIVHAFADIVPFHAIAKCYCQMTSHFCQKGFPSGTESPLPNGAILVRHKVMMARITIVSFPLR